MPAVQYQDGGANLRVQCNEKFQSMTLKRWIGRLQLFPSWCSIFLLIINIWFPRPTSCLTFCLPSFQVHPLSAELRKPRVSQILSSTFPKLISWFPLSLQLNFRSVKCLMIGWGPPAGVGVLNGLSFLPLGTDFHPNRWGATSAPKRNNWQLDLILWSVYVAKKSRSVVKFLFLNIYLATATSKMLSRESTLMQAGFSWATKHQHWHW